MRRAAGLLLVLAAAPAFAVPPWLPVPGAPDLAIDAASIDARGSVVSVSVRGAPSSLARQAAGAAQGQWHRAVLRVQFDCARRQMRGEGLVAYDFAGKAVHASTLPSAAVALPAEPALEALYDASCELGRALN